MIVIKKPILNNIDEICRIHLRAFDKSHFTANFSKQLLKSYFRFLLKSCSYSYIASEGERILGYIIGGLNPSEGVQRFTKHNFLKVLWIFLKNPGFIKEKVLEKIFKNESSNYYSLKEPTIYIIAVDQDFKTGVGQKLLEIFEKNILNENYSGYYLSVRKENLKAIKFYEKNNFILYAKTRQSFCYHKSFAQ